MKVNDELVGTVLGNYTLEKVVGYSQFSTIYLARQFHPARLVAVKIVQPQSPRLDDFFLRFRREVTNIARLDHPHILSLLDYEAHDQLAYVVMPYVGTGNLEQVLKRDGRLAPQQVLAYLLQMASALDYAHSLHAIHGDLKPTNILFNAEGRLLLTDFALANPPESIMTVDPATSLYMSPEMVRGEPLTHYSDIYQLGILLFQMLCGHLPFKGEGAYALMRQHLQETIPSVTTLANDLPLTLDRVLQKATARHPSERYKSVGELAQAFAAAIAVMDGPRQPLAHHLHCLQPLLVSNEPGQQEFIITPMPQSVAELPATPIPPAPRSTDGGPQDADFGFSYIHDQILPLPSTISRKPHLLRYFALKCLPLFVIVGIGTLALLRILGAFASSPVPATEQARLVVSQYYDDLNQHNFQQAYALCSPDFQRHTSYERFLSNYQPLLRSDVLLFKQSTERSPSEVDIVLQLRTQEKDPQGTLTHYYRWSGVVDRQPDGTWQIAQITLTIVPSPDEA